MTRHLTTIILLTMPAGTSAALIELQPTATVTGRYVRLADVAEVAAEDTETTERFEAAILAPAPVAGRKIVLEGSKIRERLRALGLNLANTEFNGRARVTVTAAEEKPAPPTVPIERAKPEPPKPPVRDTHVWRAEDLLDKALRRYLERHAPQLGKVSLEIGFPRDAAPRIVEGAVGGFEFRIEDDRDAGDWTEPRDLVARFLDRQHVVTEAPVRVRVTPWPTVLVARRTLKRGDLVRSVDLQYRQAATADGAYTNPREILDREVTKSISAGRVIGRDDVRAVPLVRRNDVITLVSRVGGINVSSYGRSRADGGLGEEVTVVTVDGSQSVVARVTGFHQAEIVTARSIPTVDPSAPLPPADTPSAAAIRFENVPEPESIPRPIADFPRSEFDVQRAAYTVPDPQFRSRAIRTVGHGVPVPVRDEPRQVLGAPRHPVDPAPPARVTPAGPRDVRVPSSGLEGDGASHEPRWPRRPRVVSNPSQPVGTPSRQRPEDTWRSDDETRP